MDIMMWDLDGSGFNKPLPLPKLLTPRLTIRCEYPDTSLPPTEVSFRLSPRYGIRDAREAHEWFMRMMAENEELEVSTDRVGEWPMPFCSETVRTVVVEP